MDDKTLQRKLNQFVKIGNELVKEAQLRYPEGLVFHEAGGGVHVMDGDELASGQRQKHIQYTAQGFARWGAGAW